MPSVQNASSVERALAILECLDSTRRGLNISEISRKLSIPKSSAHVIMVTLERLGYVQKRGESLHYTLGLKAYGLGLGMVKSLSISEAALPHMRALSNQLHLPSHLAVPDGDQGVYIQKVETPGLIKLDTYIGRRMDLHCTGVGKVILAFGPQELYERLVAKQVYIRYTRNTITSPRLLQREIAKVRKAGYAVDDEEEELAVRCVAVPVLQSGRFSAALSVTGTTAQIPLPAIEELAADLRTAAAAMAAAVSASR
ncbi:MAG: IclR family transcriptional regulator [Bryobacterales bacterium]|nr:IclR family transcriptional regulator [Bryobacterales bacterium]